MDQNLKFNQECVDLISQFEGFSAKPYPDPASGGEPITIGLGSTHYCSGKKVTLQDPPITREQATEMLLCYLNDTALPCVKKLVKANINQCMLNSLGSLIYNIGCSNFSRSSLLRFINIESTPDTIKDAWMMWVKANGKFMPGLKVRREKEISEFYKPC